MRRILNLMMAAILLLGAMESAVRAADDEMVTNPPYKHWSAFKVGTTVTQKEHVRFAKSSDEADYYPGGVREKDATYTLLEVTPEKAVVQLTIVEYGHGSTTELAPSKITYPAKVKKEHVSTSKEEIETFKEGDEDVNVLGKTIRCHWVEIIDQDGDETYYHKVWDSDEVPGGIIKEIRSQKKGNAVISESDHAVVSYQKA